MDKKTQGQPHVAMKTCNGRRNDYNRRMQETQIKPLEKAIAAVGGITALARKLGLSGHTVVHQWRLTRVPAEHCPSIEKATSRAVTCEELRPDVDWAYLRGAKRSPKKTVGV